MILINAASGAVFHARDGKNASEGDLMLFQIVQYCTAILHE